MRKTMTMAALMVIVLVLAIGTALRAQDQAPVDTPKPVEAAKPEPAKPGLEVQQLQQQVKELQGQIGQIASSNQKTPADQLKLLQDALTATLKAAYDQASAGCKALGAREMTLAITDGKPNFSCVVKVK